MSNNFLWGDFVRWWLHLVLIKFIFFVIYRKYYDNVYLCLLYDNVYLYLYYDNVYLYLFKFKINIIIIHLEYIDISPDSTLIKQHQICLYNTSHINIIN